MDYLTFISKILESLAWPTVAVVTVFCFKDKLNSLLHGMKLTSVKILDNEATLTMIESSKKAVAAEKEVIKQEMESTELPEEKRAETLSRFEDAVRREYTLDNYAHFLTNHLQNTHLSLGRQQILQTLITDVIGIENAISLPEEEMVKKSKGWIKEIRRGDHAPAGLNDGALTGLRSVALIDDDDRLTTLGAAIIKSVAMNTQNDAASALP
jgi:hypothetical protein